MVLPDFSENCGCMQYLSVDGVLYISLVILLAKNGTPGCTDCWSCEVLWQGCKWIIDFSGWLVLS